MDGIQEKIQYRIQQYLENDKTGIRYNILYLLLNNKKATIDDIYNELSKFYDITKISVSSMLGYINSRLGITQSHKSNYKNPIVYCIKEKYKSMVRNLLSKYNQFTHTKLSNPNL